MTQTTPDDNHPGCEFAGDSKKLGSDDKKSQVANLPETQNKFGSDDKKSQVANLAETQKAWLRRQKSQVENLAETQKGLAQTTKIPRWLIAGD